MQGDRAKNCKVAGRKMQGARWPGELCRVAGRRTVRRPSEKYRAAVRRTVRWPSKKCKVAERKQTQGGRAKNAGGRWPPCIFRSATLHFFLGHLTALRPASLYFPGQQPGHCHTGFVEIIKCGGACPMTLFGVALETAYHLMGDTSHMASLQPRHLEGDATSLPRTRQPGWCASTPTQAAGAGGRKGPAHPCQTAPGFPGGSPRLWF
jgi:hypothetical protein